MITALSAIFVILAGISSQNPPSGSCLCLTGTDVIVHADGGINSNKLGSISRPQCVTYAGSKITPCVHDPNSSDKRAWFKITLNGQSGWIAGDYLQLADNSKCTTSSGSTGSHSTGGSGGSSGTQQQASTGSLSNCFPGSEMEALKQKILNYEKLVPQAYNAQPNSQTRDWTVCVGFNLERSNARAVFHAALPNVDFDAVYKGQTLTNEQCMTLYTYDLDTNYVSIPKSKFGDAFCKLPVNVKIAMVSAYYRGDMGPKTEALIARGDWCHVKAEYLNHGDYINAVAKGIPGVRTRMAWNADQFQTMCNSGSNTGSSSGSASTSGSTSTHNAGSGECDPVAQEYACKILDLYNAKKIDIWNAHMVSHETDNAYALNNIRDTCNGKKAARSSYHCSLCPSVPLKGGTICLVPNLMKYLYDIGSRGYIQINEVAGACHGCGSYHYEGRAVDLQTSSRDQDYRDSCKRYGGAAIDEAGHVHCTIHS